MTEDPELGPEFAPRGPIRTTVESLSPNPDWAAGDFKAGTTIRRVRAGWVREFCPVCRTIAPFALVQVRGTSHVLHVNVRDELSHMEVACAACAVRLRVDPAEHLECYDRADDAREDGSADPPRFAQRLEIERGRTDRAGKHRRDLLREPFLVLEAMRRDRAECRRWDLPSLLALLATVVLCAGCGWVENGLRPPDRGVGEKATVVAGLLGAAVTAWMYYGQTRRHTRAVLLPLLDRALAPLEAARSEWKAVAEELAAEGVELAQVHRPDSRPGSRG